MDWEAEAIEKCRNDPAVAAAGLCHVCMCSSPCICDDQQTRRKMRAFYEAHRRIEQIVRRERTTWFGNTVITEETRVVREEPKLTGSWGADMDGLMTELFKIATERHQQELERARNCAAK